MTKQQIANGPALYEWLTQECLRLPGSPDAREWARANQIHPSNIGRWEEGSHEPSLVMMAELAEKLGRKLSDVLVAAKVIEADPNKGWSAALSEPWSPEDAIRFDRTIPEANKTHLIAIVSMSRNSDVTFENHQ